MVENSNKTIAKVDEFPASGGFHDAAVFKLRDFRADVGGTDIPHRLEFFALVFVAQDEINGEVDFARVHMPADTLLVVQPNQVLRFSLNDAADGWLLLFKPEFLPLTSENGPTLTALLQNLPPLNRLTPERAAWCRRLITLLWQTRHINPATAPAHEVNR